MSDNAVSMTAMDLLVTGLLCTALGFVLGWLLADRRGGAARATLAAERTLVDGRLAALSAQALRPVGATLASLDATLRGLETERAAAQAGLRAEVAAMHRTSEGLRTETAALVTALRAPHTRGRWGETQLRRVLEAAGALAYCDFVEQPTLGGVDGVLRPDVVVRLVGGRQLVVDAKVPLAAHLSALEAGDDVERERCRRAHAAALRQHVLALSAKAYWGQVGPSPEFVVLFVPSDAVLDAALQVDAGLQEEAWAAQVVLATPSTLVALIRTVAYTWRTDTLGREAEQIAALGRELHDRLATLGDHVGRLGRALDGAVGAFNATVGSLESRVLVSARRLGDLGAAGAPLAPVVPLDSATRSLSAPELLREADRMTG